MLLQARHQNIIAITFQGEVPDQDANFKSWYFLKNGYKTLESLTAFRALKNEGRTGLGEKDFLKGYPPTSFPP